MICLDADVSPFQSNLNFDKRLTISLRVLQDTKTQIHLHIGIWEGYINNNKN
jgi:hypothetical protein